MDNLEKREVHVSNESLMDGVRLTVAVGPAFLFREGVQYGHAIEYLRAVVSRVRRKSIHAPDPESMRDNHGNDQH